MLTELDRSMSQLQLPGFAKPFFIQYRIEEVDDFETTRRVRRERGLRAAPTSASRASPCASATTKPTAPAAAATARIELAALDNDPIALRSALWTATDQAYKTRSPPTRKSRPS